MYSFNVLDRVSETATSLSAVQQPNNSPDIQIQHDYNTSAVVAADFFKLAPAELIGLIGRYLPLVDLYSLSNSSRTLYVTIRQADDGLLKQLTRERLQTAITMITDRGFRPFNVQQKKDIDLVGFHMRSLNPQGFSEQLEQFETALAQKAANLQLDSTHGAQGRFDIALRAIDQWPGGSNTLFGRDDFNLKHMGWQALAVKLASMGNAHMKAEMFDQILSRDSHPTTHTAADMFERLCIRSRGSFEERRQLLDSFLTENGQRPPSFAFIGLLSLVPCMENLGTYDVNDELLTTRYIFDQICTKADELGPKYKDRVPEVIRANPQLVRPLARNQ